MTPKISVLIPTFNRLQWLPTALHSVLGQETDLELLILDNGSSDGTWDYLQTLAKTEPRVRVFRFEENCIDIAYGFLAEKAQGAYICYFTDDDEMLAGGLAKKAAILDAHSDIGIVYSSTREMDSDGTDLGESTMGRRFDEDRIGGAASFESLIICDHIPMPSALFRKEIRSYWQGDGHHFGPAGDWQLWLSAIRHTDAAYLREPTVRLRHHAGQDTKKRGIQEGGLLDSHLTIWRYWMLHADPPFVPAPETWRHMQVFHAYVAQHCFGPDDDALQEELRRLDDILATQRHSMKPVERPAAEAFLFEPDWSTAEWAEVIISYVEAFEPSDPVSLILPLTSSPSVGVEKATQMILQLVHRLGKEHFPDIVLVENDSELQEQLKARRQHQWIPKGKGCIEGLQGFYGEKFAATRHLLSSRR